jgi:hypothetical protein
MIPKRAIEKAIEGGWQPTDNSRHNDYYGSWNWQGIALDHSFWQALGKALGWPKTVCRAHLKQDNCGIVWTDTVGVHAHRFYDRILTGGDVKFGEPGYAEGQKNIEKFWADLLK